MAQVSLRLTVIINGVTVELCHSGALWWPDRSILIVGDLHFEKATALSQRAAGRTAPLPPYDTAATLSRLSADIAELSPRHVICLGDSFHDSQGPQRLSPDARRALAGMMSGRDWLWVAGNHDPVSPAGLGGDSAADHVEGALVFRHEPQSGAVGEIAGHLHPKASVRVRLGRITGRCFAVDPRRLILPAYGALTGGLDVLDPAIAGLMSPHWQIALIGRDRLFRFRSDQLLRGH